MISMPQADLVPAPSAILADIPTGPRRPTILPARRRPDRGHLVDLLRRLCLAAPLLAGLALAYHATLGGMVDELSNEGPLAYTPLLGLAALVTSAFISLRFHGSRPPIQDRFLDMLFGLPLLSGAVLLITVVPSRSPLPYWTERLDILSLILFGAGVVMVVAGVPWFWRMRGPLLLLALMWPPVQLQLTAFVAQGLAAVDQFVLGALGSVLPDGEVGRICTSSWLTLPSGDHPLSFAPCSGTHGLLDVALVGGAVAMCTAGRTWRKLLWLAGGATLACVVNWVWVAALMVAGSTGWLDGGPRLMERAIALTLTTTLMVALLPRYGMARQRRQPRSAAGTPAARRPVCPRRWITGTVVAAIAAILPVVGAGMPQGWPTDPTRSPVATAPFDASPALPGGWMLSPLGEDAQVAHLVDPGSRFLRYTLTAFTRPEMVLVDVLRTDDADVLTTHRADELLAARGDLVTDTRQVDLGHGLDGLLLDYREPTSNSAWATLSWVRPVVTLGHTTYERITLSLQVDPAAAAERTSGPVAVPALVAPLRGATQSPVEAANRAVEDISRQVSGHATPSRMPAALAVVPAG